MSPVRNQPLMPKNAHDFISVVKDIANKDGVKTENNLKSYTWSIDVSGSEQGAGGVGGLLSMTVHSSGKTYFYTYDGNGNVTGLVDSDNGTLVTEYEYGPFGELISDGGDIVNPFRFSTKYTDLETGLLYYGYRYMDTSTGRWLSRDPIGEEGGLNLYGFVGNDGVNRIDKLGMLGLAYKFMAEIARRAILTPIFNGLRGTYMPSDDENEMDHRQVNNTMERAIRAYVTANGSKAVNHLYEVDLMKYALFYYNTPGLTSAGWWLNGAHRVIATGQVCYNKKGYSANLVVDWVDRIDANDLKTLWNSGEPVVKRVYEAIYHIVGDLIWQTDYDVEILWNFNKQFQ